MAETHDTQFSNEFVKKSETIPIKLSGKPLNFAS